MDAGAVAITEDLFLGGALRLRQPVAGYRAGLDAVLLAAACPAKTGTAARCLDCGAGAGTAGLALARRVADVTVTLVERDGVLAALADHNILANGLAARCNIIQADLAQPLSNSARLTVHVNSFDHVIANPPYYTHGEGTRAPDHLKDGSHAMPAGQLDDWVRFAAAMAREGGSLTLIHRPDALPEALAALRRRFGRILIVPLHPRAGQPASRLLIQAIKGSRAPLQVRAGYVLHAEEGHGFTTAVDAVLRDGAALAI